MRHANAGHRAALWVRVLRVAVLSAALAAIGWRFIPRLLVRAVGDRIYLREEFNYPTLYRSGGFTVAGFTFGELEVDCSRMERPRAGTGRNLLASDGLDGPCGWTFSPHLGGKVKRDHEASGGACFCLGDEAERIVQVVDLAPLAVLADQGALSASLIGRVKGQFPDLALELLSEVDPQGQGFGSYRPAQVPAAPGWRHAAARGAIPAGTRALRVVLRRRPGWGAPFARDACFDDLSLVVEGR